MQEVLCARVRRDDLLEAIPIPSYVDDDYAPGVGSFDLWAIQADDRWFTLALSDWAFEAGLVNAIVAVPILFNARGLLDVRVIRPLAPLPEAIWKGLRQIENFPFSGRGYGLFVPGQFFPVFQTDREGEAEAMRLFLHDRGYDPEHRCQIQPVENPLVHAVIHKDFQGTTFHVSSAATGKTGAAHWGSIESYSGRFGGELTLPGSVRELVPLLWNGSTRPATVRAMVRRLVRR